MARPQIKIPRRRLRPDEVESILKDIPLNTKCKLPRVAEQALADTRYITKYFLEKIEIVDDPECFEEVKAAILEDEATSFVPDGFPVGARAVMALIARLVQAVMNGFKIAGASGVAMDPLTALQEILESSRRSTPACRLFFVDHHVPRFMGAVINTRQLFAGLSKETFGLLAEEVILDKAPQITGVTVGMLVSEYMIMDSIPDESMWWRDNQRENKNDIPFTGEAAFLRLIIDVDLMYKHRVTPRMIKDALLIVKPGQKNTLAIFVTYSPVIFESLGGNTNSPIVYVDIYPNESKSATKGSGSILAFVIQMLPKIDIRGTREIKAVNPVKQPVMAMVAEGAKRKDEYWILELKNSDMHSLNITDERIIKVFEAVGCRAEHHLEDVDDPMYKYVLKVWMPNPVSWEETLVRMGASPKLLDGLYESLEPVIQEGDEFLVRPINASDKVGLILEALGIAYRETDRGFEVTSEEDPYRAEFEPWISDHYSLGPRTWLFQPKDIPKEIRRRINRTLNRGVLLEENGDILYVGGYMRIQAPRFKFPMDVVKQRLENIEQRISDFRKERDRTLARMNPASGEDDTPINNYRLNLLRTRLYPVEMLPDQGEDDPFDEGKYGRYLRDLDFKRLAIMVYAYTIGYGTPDGSNRWLGSGLSALLHRRDLNRNYCTSNSYHEMLRLFGIRVAAVAMIEEIATVMNKDADFHYIEVLARYRTQLGIITSTRPADMALMTRVSAITRIINQGPVLERKNATIAGVTDIYGKSMAGAMVMGAPGYMKKTADYTPDDRIGENVFSSNERAMLMETLRYQKSDPVSVGAMTYLAQHVPDEEEEGEGEDEPIVLTRVEPLPMGLVNVGFGRIVQGPVREPIKFRSKYPAVEGQAPKVDIGGLLDILRGS